MNQVDINKFLAALTQKGRETAKQDITELKTRIWERVAKPSVSGTQNQNT